jgi:hypothetical protein
MVLQEQVLAMAAGQLRLEFIALADPKYGRMV